jgi:hypothetical protein
LFKHRFVLLIYFPIYLGMKAEPKAPLFLNTHRAAQKKEALDRASLRWRGRASSLLCGTRFVF